MSKIPFAFLEFGEIDEINNKKKVWDFRTGQQAYDFLMAARYFNDILGYKKMEENLGKIPENKLIGMFFDYIHHRNDVSVNLDKLLAMIAVNGRSFLELGSSLFGCIEGMSFCMKLLEKYGTAVIIDLKDVDWYGIDNSVYLNDLAVLSHPEHRIHVMEKMKELKVDTDVFFAKGVSLLYAIRKPEELMKIIESNKLCVFDYSFSMKGRQRTTVGSGKLLEYLDYVEFEELMKKSKKKMYVRNDSYYAKDNNRVFLNIITGGQKEVEGFIALDRLTRNILSTRPSHEMRTALLLDEVHSWLPIGEFMESCR